MARFRTLAAAALLPLFFAATVCVAQGGAKQLVEEIVNRLKETGNAAVVLDYVHWPTAFENLPVSDRRLMEISSAEEFRSYVNGMVTNPQEFVRREYTTRLNASAPPGLGGHAVTRFFDSGLYAGAYNLSSAVLANHQIVLSMGNELTAGPASFDASYTPAWTQAGVCEYLRRDVFPLAMIAAGVIVLTTAAWARFVNFGDLATPLILGLWLVGTSTTDRPHPVRPTPARARTVASAPNARIAR